MGLSLLFKIVKIKCLISLAYLVMSCTSTTVDEFRQGATGIESGESVVILGRRQASDFETRSEFVECIGERMERGTSRGHRPRGWGLPCYVTRDAHPTAPAPMTAPTCT